LSPRCAGIRSQSALARPHSFKLTSSRVSSTGILIGQYERDGAIKIGDTALASPRPREIASRERMKREG
jgi:hypothetical protein